MVYHEKVSSYDESMRVREGRTTAAHHLSPRPLISFNWLHWLIRGIVVGLVIGPAMYLLVLMIHEVSDFRYGHPVMLLFIPLGAVTTAWLFQKTGAYLRQGTNLAIERINERILSSIRVSNIPFQNQAHAKGVGLSPKVIPLMFVNTAITHLVGASGGKEGAGVQIGTGIASVMDWLEHKIRSLLGIAAEETDRMDITGIWLITGAGAAFGALFNAPMAGTWFGLQFASPRVTRTEAFLPCMAGSFTASLISEALGNQPIALEGALESIPFGLKPLLLVCMSGVLFGLLSLLFCTVVQVFKHFMMRLSKNYILRALYSSLLLLAAIGIFYLITGTFAYNGMSLALFSAAGQGKTGWIDPIAKLLLTALTISAGFSGGEIIPLMVIGATTGSLLAPVFGIPVSLMTVFGAIGTLSGGTKLPMVCFLLSIELFGFANPRLLFAVCVFGCICSGRTGIYQSQRDPLVYQENTSSESEIQRSKK